MFRFISAFLLCLIVASNAFGDENIFNSISAIKYEARQLGSEAVDVATTPFDTKGAGLLGTVLTAGAVGLTYVYDGNIRSRVQNIHSRSLDKATDAGNIIGNPFLHLGLAATVYGGAILADSPKYKDLGEQLGESLILADATTLALKQAIGRGRPFVNGDKGSFRPFQFKNNYDSMPSMHTASAFAMASVLASQSNNSLAQLFYYSTATFVGFSRLYKDKHWASDIILGAVIGELCGRVVTNRHKKNDDDELSLAPMVTGNSVSLALVGRW